MKAMAIVAHPDDESIFFGGLILKYRQWNWKVICVTDGNAESHGESRKKQFESACEALGVRSFEVFGFPDLYDKRLDTGRLIERLRKIRGMNRIFTHNTLGEYGHIHHQDVSYSVHQAFPKHPHLLEVGYNIYPDLFVKSTHQQYLKKTKIFLDIYRDEVNRFLNLLPAAAVEGFSRVGMAENETLYKYLSEGLALREDCIKKHKWLLPYIKEGRVQRLGNLFFNIYFNQDGN